jgi:hypothetical protein
MRKAHAKGVGAENKMKHKQEHSPLSMEEERKLEAGYPVFKANGEVNAQNLLCRLFLDVGMHTRVVICHTK